MVPLLSLSQTLLLQNQNQLPSQHIVTIAAHLLAYVVHLPEVADRVEITAVAARIIKDKFIFLQFKNLPMPSLQNIQQQIRRLYNTDELNNKTEIQTLEGVLDENEVIEYAIPCQYVNNGLAFATNKRMLFISENELILNLSYSDMEFIEVTIIDNYHIMKIQWGRYTLKTNSRQASKFYGFLSEKNK